MLTTLDILKLCVPFAFALILIWVKESYVARRERNQKMDTLWRILTYELHDILETDRKFEDMLQSYKREEISPRIYVTAYTPVEYARRIAELDHEYAYVYSDYEIEVEGAIKRQESLNSLREQFFKELDDSNRSKLASAIQEEIQLTRKGTIFLLEGELAILKRIQKARRKDKQPITEYENIVQELKKSLSM